MSGPIQQPSSLAVNPSGVVFPEVIIGNNSSVQFVMSAFGGNFGVTIDSITYAGDPVFVLSGLPALPKQLSVGGATSTFSATFTPIAQQPYSGTITITWHTMGGVEQTTTIKLVGQGINTPSTATGIPSFNPVAITFPNTALGDTSQQVLIISNVGTGPFSITSLSLAVGTDFALDFTIDPFVAMISSMVRKVVRRTTWGRYGNGKTPAVWSFITTRKSRTNIWAGITARAGLPIIIPAGASVQLTLDFIPTLPGIRTDTLLIGTNLGSTPYSVPLSGIAVLLNPIAILTSNTRQQWLAGLISGTPNVPSYQLLNPGNYNSEAAGTLVFNNTIWQSLGVEKQFNRLHLMYENLGVATLTFTLKVWRPQQGTDYFDVKTATITIGTALADGSDRSTFVDMQGSGEIMVLSITRSANSGPVSISSVTPIFIKRGEKVENV